MAAAADVSEKPTLGRLILTGTMPSATRAIYKAAYSDHRKWLDEENFSEEQAMIRDITIEKNGEKWISVNFGPSEDFDRLIEYPHSYACWMLTNKMWRQPRMQDVPWPVAILMNRLRQTNTYRFYNACVGPDRDLLEWNQETLHFSSAAWVCAHEWLGLEQAKDVPADVETLYASQEQIMQGTEPEESNSEDEIVPFENSASDVVKKHIFPLTLPSGHLNGVRSLPSCTQNKTNAWKIHRLCLRPVMNAEPGSEECAEPGLEECAVDWPRQVAEKWKEINNDDHITMAEGRYTSAFSEMGVRVHRRLMAMADVASETECDLCKRSVLSPTGAIDREVAFDEWLTTEFDSARRNAPNWKELAWYLAISNEPVSESSISPEEAAVRTKTKAAVRNYAPCREAPVTNDVHWSHSDCWIVHHFAYNAWVTVCAWAAHTQTHGSSLLVRETEVAVIWPFGLHTGKAGAIGSRAACGKPFETRIDLVCESASPHRKLVIIEFKTKMEKKNPYTEDKAYSLNKGTDCRQPVLNAWLYYFKTLRLPSKCLLLYTTRREEVPKPEAGEGNDSAVVGENDFEQVVQRRWCTQLISTFARGAYGGLSNGRYADSRILVPDLRRLMTWSKIGRSGPRSKKTNRKSKRPTKPQPPNETDFDLDGYLHVFRQMLPGSRFHCLVECAKDGTAAAGVENVRDRLNAPSEIRIPEGARVPTGIRTDGISRLKTSNDLTRLVNEWRSEPEDDTEKAKYGSAYLAYDDNEVQWLPIVLDELGRPLVLCNAKVPADKFVFRFGQPLSGQVVGAQAIIPAGGSNILRRSALLSLHSRLSMPHSMATHPLTIRRRELNGAITAATERVMRKLRRHFTRGRVEPTAFWEMTTEEIYRINLAPGGPRIREFAERHYNCAAPPDPNTPSHNYECVERCINRLLNTRLMRAMLALGGHSDFTDEHVDHGADGISWTPGLLQDFRTKELEAVTDGLRESTNTTGQPRDTPEWWNSKGPRFANDNRTRLDRFPHMSQRVMWSATAFDCLLAPVGGPDGSETMVDLVAENVENCLEIALAREY